MRAVQGQQLERIEQQGNLQATGVAYDLLVHETG